MGIHQQTWHDDFEAGQSGRGGSGVSSREGGADGAGGGYPTGFGRGWIPLERDIGIPGEDLPSAYPPAFSSDCYPVAPAEAGAYPDYPHQSYAQILGGGSDGLLPPQGRQGGDDARDEERDEDFDVNPYHFTPARRAQFLHHLAEDGNVRKACAAVGISSQAAYLARRRDRVFRSGWAAALVVARECVAQVLATRAIEGTREAVFYRGEVIGQRVRYDTRLLLAHLARLDGRAEDSVAEAHAERFDEILALVAGEDFPEDMADEPGASYDDGRHHDADPLLPMERWRHADRAGAAALSEARWGPGGTEDTGEDEDEPEPEPAPCPLERAETAARGAALDEWDGWDGRVAAVNDALAAGALPEVARLARAAGTARGEEGTPPATPATPASSGALHPRDAVTSSLAEDTPGGGFAPGGEGGWAPACAGATGEMGASDCAEAGAGPLGAAAPSDAIAAAASPNSVAPAQAGVHPDSPQDADLEERATPARSSALQSPGAVTSSSTEMEAGVAVAAQAEDDLGRADTAQGVARPARDLPPTGRPAGARPAPRAKSRRAARRAKARLRARPVPSANSGNSAGPTEPAPEFSSCTVPTVSTSPEIRPAEPAQAPQPAPIETPTPVETPAPCEPPAPVETPAPPRRVPRVITFDVDQFGNWR